MGFRETKQRVIQALRTGQFEHEMRANDSTPEKNDLYAGRVTVEEVVQMLLACNGRQYKTAPHHQMPCDVHIFSPNHRAVRWYVKVYFLSELPADPDLPALEEPGSDTIFISVHPSEHT